MRGFPRRTACALVLAATAGVAHAGAAQGARIAPSRVAVRLDSLVRAWAAAGDFSGAVLVARRGAVVYEGAFGEANREWHVPNGVATRFRIASTTKQFTAALVLHLVEQGRLRLDGHVSDYLPDYPAKQGARLTLRHLLTHTAGLPDYPRLPGFHEREAGREHSTAGLLALFDSLPLEFAPGARWSYSNSDYVVLGAVVERVTGKPYRQALREELLVPLGLGDTDYDDPADIVPQRAAGYLRTKEGVVNAPYIDPSAVFAAGMLRSTVGDLRRWAQLLHDGKVVRDTALAREMLTPAVETGTGLGGYAFGLFVGDQTLGARTVRVVQHGGTINGFTSGFWMIPSEDAVVVVLDNTMSHRTPELTRALATLLLASPR